MPSWRPHCLRGSIYETQPARARPQSEISVIVPDIDEERRGVAEVELQKKEGCGLGLTVSGGSDKGCRPHISNLRPGSIAHRSDALLVGDFIVSVNGIRTSGLKHDEIINLLKNAGEKITLEVEYEMPEPASSQPNVHSRQWEVTLDKEGPGYGFTLRGGMKVDTMRPFPFTVVAIRAGSSADRDGHIKLGDRVLQVNGYKVTHLTLSEIWSLLKQCGHQTTFTMAYDVAVMDAVEQACGPLLVEVDKTAGSALGIVLAQSSYQGKACVGVESIRPMSIADRSGAVHVGDHILCIDGASVEHMSVAEATQLLKSGTDNLVRLEILPFTHLQHCASREALARNSLAPSMSSVTIPSLPPVASAYSSSLSAMPPFHSHAASTSAIGHLATLSRGSRSSALSKHSWPAMGRKVNSCMSMVSSGTSVRTANNQVCHTETVQVLLFADVKGLGFTLEGGVFSTAILSHPPTIALIEPRSAADKCGLLQEGDRILNINGMDTSDRTLEELNHLLRECRPRCLLEVEFDVAESVTPSCGTYTVRLVKKAGGTGITVGGRKRPNQPLVIIDVVRAGAAHRCGSIQPGDKLLAINDVSLDSCTVEDATHLLELPDDLVKLKVQRDDPEEGNKDCVIYTVQLHRHGGPLGITISGTEDPLDDIVISELTPGGLAQKTAAMHVGDRLLGINDSTTKNKPLSEAIRMLQGAGDKVTLKIARPCTEDELQSKFREAERCSKVGTSLPSVDSAMESWDSMGQDMSGGPLGPSLSQALVVAVPQPNPPSSSDDRMGKTGDGEELTDEDWPEEDDDDDDDEEEEEEEDCCKSQHSEEAEQWARTLGDLEASSGSEMLRQISASLRQRSTFSLDRASSASDCGQRIKSSTLGRPSNASDCGQRVKRRVGRRSQSTSRVQRGSRSQDAIHSLEWRSNEDQGSQVRTFDQQLQTIFTPTPIQLLRVSMEKSCAATDFGFSLSDGMYEKGVYVSAVRTGSPAQKAGVRAYDRVLQVNGYKTRDFDCCMTVPLIAEAGNKLNLVICRNPLLRQSHLFPDNFQTGDEGELKEKRKSRDKQDYLPGQLDTAPPAGSSRKGAENSLCRDTETVASDSNTAPRPGLHSKGKQSSVPASSSFNTQPRNINDQHRSTIDQPINTNTQLNYTNLQPINAQPSNTNTEPSNTNTQPSNMNTEPSNTSIQPSAVTSKPPVAAKTSVALAVARLNMAGNQRPYSPHSLQT